MTNKITVNIDSMNSAGLGIKGIKADTEQDATYAIDAIADAISTVSSQRSALGAVQNRLEHTINNLDNVVENTTTGRGQGRPPDRRCRVSGHGQRGRYHEHHDGCGPGRGHHHHRKCRQGAAHRGPGQLPELHA